jgi:hypothetical protein
MHRPRHLHTVVAMRGAAALLLLSVLLCASTICVAIYALIDIDRPLLLWALGLFVAFVGSLIGYRYFAGSARCPLCMGPVLLSRQCSHHKKALTLYGSYRLRVAKDIVLRNGFSCPYCGEPTKCEVRVKAPEPLPPVKQKRPSSSQNPESW